MTKPWFFPFGQPVQDIVQTDRTQKQIFVLGVYSSAVHARWVSTAGKNIVTALAVASEPYIFWRGDHAEEIIKRIPIPETLGRLLPANRQFNGPSGIALDDLILNPLGLERKDAWLCDLVPHSCVNPAQQAAIERSYTQIACAYSLPEHTVPTVPAILSDEKRRNEILSELIASDANTLIILGDKPIEWFLRYFTSEWKKLSDFGCKEGEYGNLHDVCIDGRKISILPLAHPRQIAKLGQSSSTWFNLHQNWLRKSPRQILQT